jgi:HK97 family phage major capsid protein
MTYSVLDAIAAMYTGSWGRVPSHESRESDALADKAGVPSVGRAIMPGAKFTAKRTSLVASGSSLVPTDTKGFLPSLQATSVVGKLGATYLSLDQTATKTPIITNASTPTFQSAEGVTVAESNLTVGLRTWVPHHLPLSLVISGQLLKQQKNTEEWLLSEILREAAAVTDFVCLQGDGASGRPTGIVNTSGVTTASGTALAYSGLVAGVEAVSLANSILDFDAVGYVGAPGVAAALKQRQGATASEVMWAGGLARGLLDGETAYATNNCPTGDLIFGDFSNLIVGVFGDSLSFDADPFTNFQSNMVTLRLWLTLDIQLRSPAGFTVFTGVT